MDSVFVIGWILAPLATRALAAENASGNTDLIPTLLTGGGFVFLAALMTGLFLWNKNQAEGANAIAQGATELVGPMSEQLQSCRRGMEELRQATEKIADGFDMLTARATPVPGTQTVTITVTLTELAAINGSIREARKHLH